MIPSATATACSLAERRNGVGEQKHRPERRDQERGHGADQDRGGRPEGGFEHVFVRTWPAPCAAGRADRNGPAPHTGIRRTAGPPPSAGTVTRKPPKRILRTGEEGPEMASDADKTERAKADRFAKPRAIGCAVVAAVVLAVVLAWFLGFFGWLAS